MTDQVVDTGSTPTPDVPGGARHPTPATPLTPSQLVGRTRELKELRADIAHAGLDTIAGRKAARARVLLIAGRPGSGRTALAGELARQVAHRYPDGVLSARLTDPDGTPVRTARVARQLLDQLGLPVPPGADEDDLTGDLRDALVTRRALLLLDDADDAQQVDPLLPDAPDCLVVAVSEGPLTGIPGVRPCTLGGLDTESGVELLSRYTGSVRITCDPRAAESLVERCGAHPAALQIAGGWLAARPQAAVADLARRLGAQPDEGPVLDRVFRYVYGDMPASAARTLRLLSLAPAGLVDPHTASALAGCSVEEAHGTLDDFVAFGLLRAVDSPLPQYEVPGCLLPLLRARTAEQDRPAELQLARARMLERTVRLLRSCRAGTEPEGTAARRELAALPRTLRFPSRSSAARWLDIRGPALLAAARMAVADGGLDTLARRLMAALVRALAAHQGPDAAAADLYGVHELVLVVAERRGLHRERAAALLNLADLDARGGRDRAALERYRTALDAARRAKDPYATGRAMESLGGGYERLGDWARAADWFGRALTQRLARAERSEAARLYGRIADVQTSEGRYDEAARNWRACAAAYRKVGETGAMARALSELALVHEHADRPDESLRTCHEAVQWARQAGDERLQATLRLRLADILERLGDPAAARLHRSVAHRVLGDAPSGAPRGGDTPPAVTPRPRSAPGGTGDPAGTGPPPRTGDTAGASPSAETGHSTGPHPVPGPHHPPGPREGSGPQQASGSYRASGPRHGSGSRQASGLSHSTGLTSSARLGHIVDPRGPGRTGGTVEVTASGPLYTYETRTTPGGD